MTALARSTLRQQLISSLAMGLVGALILFVVVWPLA
jgi:hypothetical protein